MRKTKIICTIGPASESADKIEALCRAGMNVARLNFSHGTHDEHEARIKTIKEVRERLGMPIAILLDTKGPEFRIGRFAEGRIELTESSPFTFTTEDIEGDGTIVSVSYKNLARELEEGDIILVNNGLVSFRVKSTDGVRILTEVVCGGELSDRKSMSFPGKHIKQPYLSEQDKSDIKFGIEQGVDFIACSFVSVKQDLVDVREYLESIGGYGQAGLIAKIENQSGIDNIEEIFTECDGIMVARGDMGVEVPFENLPAIQKSLITKCRMLGKRSITATEMLESMIHQPRPTRAETSDVANAVYDGTSAVMLSGETAAGEYPVEAVTAMARITEATENSIDYAKRFRESDFVIEDESDAISHATCGMAIDIGARAIVACTLSGKTARMVSRFRAPVDIVGMTTDERVYRRLALSWAVIPKMCNVVPSTDVLFYEATNKAREALRLAAGDRLVITGGITNGLSGNTNLIKVERIPG